MNEDFIRGWQAAREQYQATGGVQPYPPGYYEQEVFEPPQGAIVEPAESDDEGE